MTQIAEAYVRVRPDTTGFRQEATRQVGRDLRGVERQLQASNREMTRFARGALVGTGALRELGRAAAFASLSFIGGAGIVVGIRSTIKAATEAEASLALTRNAVEKAGVSWVKYGQQIQDAALEQSQLSGIDDERFQRTFTVLLRATGDVNRALEDNALAANIARGANLELEQAAKIVARAEAGQARGLAQLGVVLEKGATRTQILDALTRKFAGSTEAFSRTAAGAQARFSVAINETQEAIGTALLPTVTEYLDKLTEWLNKTENQEKIQRNAAKAADITADSLAFVGKSIDTVTAAVEKLRDLPLGDQGSHGIMGAILGRIPGFDTGVRKLGEDIYIIADALGAVADGADKVAAAEARVAQSQARNRITGPGGILGAFQEDYAEFLSPRMDVMSDADRTSTAARVAGLNRNQQTAVDLARAQAGGQRSAIEAAIAARLGFVQDTIAFANKLLAQGRGDTAKLAQTLEQFHGEQGQLNSIIEGFMEDDQAARDKRIQDAKDAAAEWREQNHQYHLAVEAMLKQGREFHENFKRQLREQAEDQRARLETRDLIRLQIIQNRIAATNLLPETDRALKTRRDAQKLLIRFWREQAKNDRLSTLEQLQARAQALSAQNELRNIGKKDKEESGGRGFTLSELFSEAGEQFATYGSNVGPAGAALSGQDARGALAQTIKTHQVHVTQIFNIPVPTSQAMIDARNAAKNLQ